MVWQCVQCSFAEDWNVSTMERYKCSSQVRTVRWWCHLKNTQISFSVKGKAQKMVRDINQRYRIDRRAGYQGSRPSVISQAGVEKCATGCDSLSLSSTTSGTRNQILTVNNNSDKKNGNNRNINKNKLPFLIIICFNIINKVI